LKSDLHEIRPYLTYLNVKENQFTVIFEAKQRFSYIIEVSADLREWKEVQNIDGKGDMIQYRPESKFSDKARFFRVRLDQ
ncbi:MAG TPA: hypothetical protein QGG93_05035, partial [Verrucomicrobiota bacterium]|nr:hypothetical protein [Verrucomicrobiota bacterium]